MKRVLILLFVLAFFPCLSFAQIYKWTDENGVTHWTNTAPPESVKEAEKTGEYVSHAATESEDSVGYQSGQLANYGKSGQKNDLSNQKGNSPGCSDAYIKAEAQKLNERMKELDRHHYRSSIRSTKEKENYLQKRERLKNKMSALENSPKQYLDENRATRERVNTQTTRTTVNKARGPILDTSSGTVMPPVAGGHIDPRDGTFHQDVAGGVVNTKTGQFSPVN